MIQTCSRYHYFYQKPSLVLERLQISLAFDIDTAQALVDDLIQNINVRAIACPSAFLTSSFQAHRRILVIDAVTPLLGPLLGPASAQGHAIMTDFMRQLQFLAKSTNITILVSCYLVPVIHTLRKISLICSR